MISSDEILEALDLSRAEPGAGFLEALFVRFNASVPFENASKLVRHAEIADAEAKPRRPEVFWRDHLELGAGGTCFARVAAFDALLTDLGYRTRSVLGRVRKPNDHAALVVETKDGEVIVDVGFPLPVILPAGAAVVEAPTVTLRVSTARAGFDVSFEGGVPEGPRSISIESAPAPAELYNRLWHDTFREGAPFLGELSLQRHLGPRILSFARGEIRVDDRYSRLRAPLLGARAGALSALFGIDEALLSRALAIAGDPDPSSPDAILTAYLETDGSPDRAYEAIGSPAGYRRLLEGLGKVGPALEIPSGFRLDLSPEEGGGSAFEEDVTLDPANRRIVILRRSKTGEQRFSYRVREESGQTWLEREARLAGAREDLLRNDSLRGRLAGTLGLDVLAWSRLL